MNRRKTGMAYEIDLKSFEDNVERERERAV